MKKRGQPPPYRASSGGLPYHRDRLGFITAASNECGAVWKMRRGIYVAASFDTCVTVLQRTTHEYTSVAGTFELAPRPEDALPVKVERSRARAARMRGLRTRAVAFRVDLVAQGIAAFAEGWPVDQDIVMLPRVHTALAGIGNCYLFGPDDGPGLAQAVEGLWQVRQESPPVKLPAWLPIPQDRRRNALIGEFVSGLQEVIDRRRSHGELGDDLLGQMLRPSKDYGTLPDRVIIDDLTAVAVAMFEVPTRTVGWLLLALAQHPQMAELIAAEAQSLPAAPEAVTQEHVDNLAYTEAFVHEVLRLHPPSWLLIRRAVEPTDLGGYPIKPGTKVLVCPYTANRDPDRFPDSDDFQPQRWLRGQGGGLKGNALLSFGGGPNFCSGAALGMVELTLIAAETARRYQLYEPLDGPSHQVHTNGNLTPVGLRLRVTPRH
jgi:cytochrome P450